MALLLLAYALGAGTSLALALLAGGRLARALKRSLRATAWLRRALGGAVLVSVGAIALGLEQASLARFSLADTNALEQTLLAKAPVAPATGAPVVAASQLPVLGTLPPFPKGAVWLNSAPLKRDSSGARWCWWTSGPLPASTVCAPFPMCGPGPGSTRTTVSW